MKIWVDADACPHAIKDILYRAVARTGIDLVLVANKQIRFPKSYHISLKLVGSGFDVADNEIVRSLEPGDLVVTADIPLASEALNRGAHVLGPRGETYTQDSIRARLTLRDFMDTLRASGIDTGGPPAMAASDRKAFADRLDAFLSQYGRNKHQ